MERYMPGYLAPDTLHKIRDAPQEDNLRPAETDNQQVFALLKADSLGLTFKHQEYPFDEFKRTLSLHQQYNQFSPGIAVGDVDGNGLDDIFIGADSSKRAHLISKNPPAPSRHSRRAKITWKIWERSSLTQTNMVTEICT